MKLQMRSFMPSLVAGVLSLCAFVVAAPAAQAQEKTLRVRFYDDPAGFDPANIFRTENENIAFNIFSGLTTYSGASGDIAPDLAESWETTDNKRWVFKLRHNVKWHKGFGDFTSADVVYSYNRIRDPATASPYASEFASIDKIEAPDDYTVVIELKAPDGNFLHSVANYHQGQIVNKKAIEAAGRQVRWQPIGTGPFYLDQIDVNSRIVLKRNADYFRGKAPIETIIFQIIKDESTAAIALRKGEVDLVMRSNRQENLETLQKEGFVMNRVDDYAPSLRIFNPKNKALSDVRVRRAIAYAIDYDAINKATAPLLQKYTASILEPWMAGYTADVPTYPYNPELAKKLLAEAGYAKGLTFKNLSTSAQGVTEFQQFEIDYLAQVGVKMEMELVDTPTFNQRRNNGDFESTTRLLPAVNPDMVLFSYLHPENIAPKGLNGAFYNNPRVTELLDQVRSVLDAKKRKDMYAEIQKIVMTDLFYLPIYSNAAVWPGKKNVTGVKVNFLAQVGFFDVDIK
jgi:peptide/nickel transport system substrate-binding protein